MDVFYFGHRFEFHSSTEDTFAGRLDLDQSQRSLLKALNAHEDEWYLDENGERLHPELLFDGSPWSCIGPDGPLKLLCRFLDVDDGRATFQTRELYPGELFGWMRDR